LRSRRGTRADHHPRDIVLPFPRDVLAQRAPFMEQELHRKRIGFCKNDNAFLATDDVAAALQAHRRPSQSADNRKQLDYRTLILGPRFSKKEGGQMSRRGSIHLRSHCYNLVSMRNLIHPQSSAKASEARCGLRPQRRAQNSRHANFFIIC